MAEYLEIDFAPLQKRGISVDTCTKYGYGVAKYNGQPVHVANYYHDGELVGQKLRFADKSFKYLHGGIKPPFFGQHIWNGGKMLVVTEGEIDCLTVSQVQGNKWPVVSVPNGADGAAKAVARNLEWLETFDTVVFMFDEDEPGRRAAKECAALLSNGKAKIATLPLKDPNEMLLKGRGAEIIPAIWNAKEYRPDGVIAGKDTLPLLKERAEITSIPYPLEALNKKTRGIRRRELVVVTAGTGIGKSSLCRQLALHLNRSGERVGYLALEESVAKTVESLVSLELEIPLHLRPEDASEQMKEEAWKRIFDNDRFFLYDHWGSTDVERLLGKMRYLVRTCGCTYLFLDHISIMVSGIGEGDERRLIDNVMTALRKFVEETDVALFAVSHLRKAEGDRGWENGKEITAGSLRGSASIAQLADIGIGLERDQQDEEHSDISTVRILKNRFSGETGVSGFLRYDVHTGLFVPADLSEQPEPKKKKRRGFNDGASGDY